MKRRITTFITAIITIPTIIFVFALCAFMASFISQQKVDSLRMSVENLTNYISAIYNAQLEGTLKMTENQNLRAYIKNPGDQNLRNEASAVFYDVFNGTDNIFQSELFLPDGQVLLTTSNTETADSNQSQDFRHVTETHEPYISIELYQDIPLLDICYPIKEGDNLIGIYKRLTPLVYLHEYAKTMIDNEENVLIIGNATGLIFNRDSQGTPQIRFFENFDEETTKNVPAIQELISPETEKLQEGTINYDYNDRSTLGVYKRIDNINWICMISQSRASIFYNLNLFQLITIIVSAIIITIIFFITRHYVSGVFRQINRFNTTIEDFLSGNTQARTHANSFEIINELGHSINNLLDESTKNQTYAGEMEHRLNIIEATDPVTNLGNNVSLYRQIDENFEKHHKQALIMFNMEGYEDILNTFGNSVTNRLLEITAHTLLSMGEDNFIPTRLAKDTFCIYIPEYNNRFEVEDLIAKLYQRLKSINHIDDLQIELKPHVAVVFKNPSLLDRSAWLGLTANQLNEATVKDKKILILDYDEIDESEVSKPEGYENILNKDITAVEGFSKSSKKKE